MRVNQFWVFGAVVAALFSLSERASAVPAYQATGSTATFQHDPDLGVAGVPALGTGFVGTGTLTPRTNPKSFSPLTTMPTPPSYQFATTDTRPAGAGNSVAKASAAHVTNATTAAVKVASGTGVTQTSNVVGAYSGASELRINVDVLWNITSTNPFGPPASGLANFAVGGKVGAGAGSYAEFDTFLEFLNPLAPGTSYRSPVLLSDHWERGDADVAADGTFSKLFADSVLLNLPTASLPPGSKLELKGYIAFRARSLPATVITGAFADESTFVPLSLASNSNDDKDKKEKNENEEKENPGNGLGPDGELDCDDPPEHGHVANGDGVGHDPEHGNVNDNGNQNGWHQGHLHGCGDVPPGVDLETFVGFPQEQILGGAVVFGEAVPEPMTAALAAMGVSALALAAIRRRA